MSYKKVADKEIEVWTRSHEIYRNDLPNFSIDTSIIISQIQMSNSDLVNNLMKNKIDRPEDKSYWGLSYYWQDNKEHVYLRLSGDNRCRFCESWCINKSHHNILLSIDNIYRFKLLDETAAIIFDTDSSFYYIALNCETSVSQRHVILNNDIQINGHKIPVDNYEMETVGLYKLCIRFSDYSGMAGLSGKERVLVYLIDKDVLIQDLDELINNRKLK